VGLAVGDGVADAEADDDPDGGVLDAADAEAEADADPLCSGVAIGVGLGLGVGKMELGILANERAKMSTKMTITTTTQILARLSVRGGSEPRYPAEDESGPRSGAERR
jgi:hypothetical protein